MVDYELVSEPHILTVYHGVQLSHRAPHRSRINCHIPTLSGSQSNDRDELFFPHITLSIH